LPLPALEIVRKLTRGLQHWRAASAGYWIAIFAASTIAGFIPALWGSGLLSLW